MTSLSGRVKHPNLVGSCQRGHLHHVLNIAASGRTSSQILYFKDQKLQKTDISLSWGEFMQL